MTRFAHLLTVCGAVGCLAAPASAAPNALGDFDGDGYADMAVGAPADSVAGQRGAGAVNVIRGSASGPTASGDQQFTQRGVQMPGVPVRKDRFGYALAAGDLDGDGYADLAIGIPGEDVSALRDATNAGAVQVLYGSPQGLRSRGQLWNENSLGVPGNAQSGDRLGMAVAIGDVDGDGYDDLAMGAPGEAVAGRNGAGAVTVLYGSADGLSADRAQRWSQRGPVAGGPEPGDAFGRTLAIADVSGDERADLLVGVPGEGVADRDDAGAVNVLFGRAGGLTAAASEIWTQASGGIKGAAEPGDRFGSAIAVSDTDRDGIGDVVIGVPGEGIGGARNAGAVAILPGSSDGLRRGPDRLLFRGARNLEGSARSGDRFGATLAVGDVSAGGGEDVVVGAPGVRGDRGAVQVIYGQGGAGLAPANDQVWHQGREGIPGSRRSGDDFGASLAIGDLDSDGAADLVVGIPGQNAPGTPNAGAVNVIPGSTTGLTAQDARLISQGSPGIQGAVGNDRFGAATASGRPGGG